MLYPGSGVVLDCIVSSVIFAVFLTLFCSVFNKSILDATIPTFQELGGVTQPLIFC